MYYQNHILLTATNLLHFCSIPSVIFRVKYQVKNFFLHCRINSISNNNSFIRVQNTRFCKRLIRFHIFSWSLFHHLNITIHSFSIRIIENFLFFFLIKKQVFTFHYFNLVWYSTYTIILVGQLKHNILIQWINLLLESCLTFLYFQ